MDHTDYLGWMWEGGGHDLWIELYQKELKLNLMPFSAHPTSPQAFGWFKRPIKNLADFKGMKCRQTGINAEVFQRMGMSTVNMPGGEIIPAAQRGVIDCAEWVGGIEDLRLGLHQVWKYHYTPGLHENNTIGELTFNLDVWKSLAPVQQEQVRSALRDAFISWIAKNQKENADALKEFREKHGVQVLRTPPDILIAYLKAWDDLAQEESGSSPFFKKVYGFAARLGGGQRAGEALHAAALLLRRELLLAGKPQARGSKKCHERAPGVHGRRPGAADQPLLRRGALRQPAVHRRHPAHRRKRQGRGRR